MTYLMGRDDALRHAKLKLSMGDIRPEAAARRLVAALEATPARSSVDFAAMEYAARHPEPPPTVFHTAPTTARVSIECAGLRVSQPGAGGSWAPNKEICVMLQASQVPGIYVGAEPDLRGVWSHWSGWDVWAVRLDGLDWAHDGLNPGSFVIVEPVPASAVSLYAEASRHDGPPLATPSLDRPRGLSGP